MFCFSGKTLKFGWTLSAAFLPGPVWPYVNCITIHVKNLKGHWYKMVKSAMLTKIIIAISVTGFFPAHQEA